MVEDQLQTPKIMEIRPRDQAIDDSLDERLVVVLLYAHCDLF